MKTTKIFAAILTGTIACAATLPVSAETLNDVIPSNSTEVKAEIVDPGTVSYTITIPATADFGTLSMPENTDTDHYLFSTLSIEATELNIKRNQGVSVYVKDSKSTDDQFYLEQQNVDAPFAIAYDVYDTKVDETNVDNYDAINVTDIPGSYGYHLITFRRADVGTSIDTTLVLNQNALYGQYLSDIAGTYSGTLNFHSALVEIPQ